jgi:hypothetical protein
MHFYLHPLSINIRSCSTFKNLLTLVTAGIAFGGPAAIDEEDEEALMQRALEMSMREMMSSTENSKQDEDEEDGDGGGDEDAFAVSDCI